jgi:site-specific DNA-methyltransferase (adenine-specific)
MKYQIINGDNRAVLKTFPDNHFDSIVTDPPYGIDFLGKSWDANTGALETYQECLRVLKPGGHILAFSAARTYHHLAITLEQAGFEIRDQIMWIYSSGFPKSQDVGRSIQRSLGVKETRKVKSTDGYNLNNAKGFTENNDVGYGEMKPIAVCTDPLAQQWQGWGTALKPAHEPIALARKPIKLSIRDNVVKHGVGALNIDACRVGDEILEYVSNTEKGMYNGAGYAYGDNADKAYNEIPTTVQGRFPSNVLGEIPDYQKYFYCPKVSRRERHIGYDIKKVPVIEFNDPGKIKEHPLWDPSIGTNVQRLKEKIRIHNESCIPTDPGGMLNSATGNGHYTGNKQTSAGNNHPTVKPIELMKYLIKLVTPKGGRVLDPFNGSGSTGCAAVELGCEYVGIELDPAYVEIATKRIEAWNKEDTNFKELFTECL